MDTKVLAGALVLSLWGGAALADDYTQSQGEESQTERMTPPATSSQTTVIIPQDVEPDLEPTSAEFLEQRGEQRDEDWLRMHDVSITVGAGVEGYTGTLRPEIEPGFAWSVTAGFKPTRVLGLELGYTGSVNELGNDAFFQDVSEGATGADLVRNGGHVLATVGLMTVPVQPYLLGGVGLSWWNARATGTTIRDDAAGVIPLGGGIRAHYGAFTADARLHYNILFNDEFSSTVVNQDANPGSYMGTISIGSSF
jgi:opacity protein-like surface antigen